MSAGFKVSDKVIDADQYKILLSSALEVNTPEIFKPSTLSISVKNATLRAVDQSTLPAGASVDISTGGESVSINFANDFNISSDTVATTLASTYIQAHKLNNGENTLEINLRYSGPAEYEAIDVHSMSLTDVHKVVGRGRAAFAGVYDDSNSIRRFRVVKVDPSSPQGFTIINVQNETAANDTPCVHMEQDDQQTLWIGGRGILIRTTTGVNNTDTVKYDISANLGAGVDIVKILPTSVSGNSRFVLVTKASTGEYGVYGVVPASTGSTVIQLNDGSHGIGSAAFTQKPLLVQENDVTASSTSPYLILSDASEKGVFRITYSGTNFIVTKDEAKSTKLADLQPRSATCYGDVLYASVGTKIMSLNSGVSREQELEIFDLDTNEFGSVTGVSADTDGSLSTKYLTSVNMEPNYFENVESTARIINKFEMSSNATEHVLVATFKNADDTYAYVSHDSGFANEKLLHFSTSKANFNVVESLLVQWDGNTSSTSDDSGLSTLTITLIVILCVVLLSLTYYVRTRSKTTSEPKNSGLYASSFDQAQRLAFLS